LLFAIGSSREAIPFPVIFEILLMEVSFELIREAGLRIASSFSTTVGIIGALILGDAAVSANIVSPILIIIIAFTGICSFAIPDFSLGFSLRVFRFMYIFLGYIAGFLGIAFGFFIHFLLLNRLSSFGTAYFTPYLPISEIFKNTGFYLKPIWKREKRDNYLNTKRPELENKISMTWRNYGE
jgi:spore germination protein KA